MDDSDRALLSNMRVNILTVVAREAFAIAQVSGISFGQTSTQFWALPQSAMPPSLHQRVEALVLVHRARRVRVEEDHLGDRRRADERRSRR